MKKIIVLISLSLIISMVSCGGKEEVRYYNQMIPLTQSDVSNFVHTLPLFLRLSQEINAKISTKKNSDEIYSEYLRLLSTDKRFKSSILKGNFQDMEHYMQVSFNTYQAHSYIQKMGTNYEAVMKQTYGSLIKKQAEIVEIGGLTNADIDTNVIKYKKASLVNEFMLYSNMLVVHSFTPVIEKIKIENQ